MKIPYKEGGMRLFIADDSKVVRERLSALLSELDSVEIFGQARAVQEAISSIRELKPDLVILDIKMPGAADWVLR
jgi:DNA-binding NarL/FixJ family response regulator